MEKFYLLVVGSRSITDYDLVRSYLDALVLTDLVNFDIVIVSGGAKGVDSMAERYAEERGFDKVVIKADWNRFGKSAGYRRNAEMHKFIAQFPNRACIAFWDGKSKGTAHNFDLVKQYNTPLTIYQQTNN